MACDWGFENGPNFNWPVWSVSVEVLVYIIFFMVMRYLGTSLVYNILLVVGAAFLSYFFGSPITTCLVYFFLGGIIISLQSSFKGRFKILMTLGVLLYFVLIFIVYRKTLDEHIFFVGAFPSIVYFFTEYFKCPKFAEKWVEMLGNLTYSSYLIHFPFQLAIAVIFSYLGKKIPFYNVYFLLGYLFIVLILARLIYSYFETPAQNFLRKKFLKRNSKKTSQSLKFDIGV
jgi:peptidoglycan/LPS O-acetylase OafA/YrhL